MRCLVTLEVMGSQYLTNPHAEWFQTTEWWTKTKPKNHSLQSVIKSKWITLLSNRQALLLVDGYSISNNLSMEEYIFIWRTNRLLEFIRHLYILMHVFVPESWKYLKTRMKRAVSIVIAAILFSWGGQEIQCF